MNKVFFVLSLCVAAIAIPVPRTPANRQSSNFLAKSNLQPTKVPSPTSSSQRSTTPTRCDVASLPPSVSTVGSWRRESNQSVTWSCPKNTFAFPQNFVVTDCTQPTATWPAAPFCFSGTTNFRAILGPSIDDRVATELRSHGANVVRMANATDATFWQFSQLIVLTPADVPPVSLLTLAAEQGSFVIVFSPDAKSLVDFLWDSFGWIFEFSRCGSPNATVAGLQQFVPKSPAEFFGATTRASSTLMADGTPSVALPPQFDCVLSGESLDIVPTFAVGSGWIAVASLASVAPVELARFLPAVMAARVAKTKLTPANIAGAGVRPGDFKSFCRSVVGGDVLRESTCGTGPTTTVDCLTDGGQIKSPPCELSSQSVVANLRKFGLSDFFSEPTCGDGVQNGDESGVDCGGGSCPKCVCRANFGQNAAMTAAANSANIQPKCPPLLPYAFPKSISYHNVSCTSNGSFQKISSDPNPILLSCLSTEFVGLLAIPQLPTPPVPSLDLHILTSAIFPMSQYFSHVVPNDLVASLAKTLALLPRSSAAFVVFPPSASGDPIFDQIPKIKKLLWDIVDGGGIVVDLSGKFSGRFLSLELMSTNITLARLGDCPNRLYTLAGVGTSSGADTRSRFVEELSQTLPAIIYDNSSSSTTNSMRLSGSLSSVGMHPLMTCDGGNDDDSPLWVAGWGLGLVIVSSLDVSFGRPTPVDATQFGTLKPNFVPRPDEAIVDVLVRVIARSGTVASRVVDPANLLIGTMETTTAPRTTTSDCQFGGGVQCEAPLTFAGTTSTTPVVVERSPDKSAAFVPAVVAGTLGAAAVTVGVAFGVVKMRSRRSGIDTELSVIPFPLAQPAVAVPKSPSSMERYFGINASNVSSRVNSLSVQVDNVVGADNTIVEFEKCEGEHRPRRFARRERLVRAKRPKGLGRHTMASSHRASIANNLKGGNV